MYHIGKIIKVFRFPEDESKSADNSVQVLLEMWDENEIIVSVHPALNSEVKEKDFVFVKYTQPEAHVVKILSQKNGKVLWEKFSEILEKKKKVSQYSNLRDNPVSRMIG